PDQGYGMAEDREIHISHVLDLLAGPAVFSDDPPAEPVELFDIICRTGEIDNIEKEIFVFDHLEGALRRKPGVDGVDDLDRPEERDCVFLCPLHFYQPLLAVDGDGCTGL